MPERCNKPENVVPLPTLKERALPRAAESLTAYFMREIVEDSLLAEYRAHCRALPPPLFAGPMQFFQTHTSVGPSVSPFPVEVPAAFTPARFSVAAMTATHDGLDRFSLSISVRAEALLDRLWNDGLPLRETLDIRMAAQPRYDLGDNLPREPDPPRDPFLAERAKAIQLWRDASRRRDILVASLCDDFRSGKKNLTGFLANDMNRRCINVPAGWLSDPMIKCFWRQGELRPVEAAPDGTPHFRGLMVSAAVVRAPKRRGPQDPQTKMAAAKMLADVRKGRETLDSLEAMKPVALAQAYGVARDTAQKALRFLPEFLGFETLANSGKE